jgi:phosphatidylglycerol:prolipoprotein diacylglycerol transferase
MLPYFEQPAWQFGPLTVHAFGIAVAAALWWGLAMAPRRFERAGLDAVVGQRLGTWMVIGGIAGAHLFSVLLYFPDKLRQDPWLLLRFWEDISSFGGLLGGVLAGLCFFAIRLQHTPGPTKLAYFDAVAFVFPAALAIGRVGCALAHDHPGVVTAFPLAISLESEPAREYLGGLYDAAGLAFPSNAASMGFHDLGVYEFLFLALVVVPLFAYWNRGPKPAGFYLLAFFGLYLPVRFALDMLRVADERYVGLTPAQWVAAFVMIALPFVAVPQRKLRLAITGAVILCTVWACWSGTG